MFLASTIHCVKTRMDNLRNSKPSLDAIQMSFLSWFMGKKHLESQSINSCPPEWILRVHYVAWRIVWATGGPINQLSMQSKCLPLTLILLQRAKVLLKSQNILYYNESMWVNMNGSCEYITFCVKTGVDNRGNNEPTLDAIQRFTAGIKVVRRS